MSSKGFFKKVAVGAMVGLSFGLFAGVGLFAVNEVTSFVKKTVDGKIVIEKSFGSSNDDSDGIFNPLEKLIEGSSSHSDTSLFGENEDTEELAENSEDAKAAGAVLLDEPDGDVISDSEPKEVYTTVTDVTEVVKKVMPSVVSVSNKYVAKMNYFGQTFQQEAQSAGSGIIVGQNDTELLLVSNNHVVADAEELAVTFVDGTSVEAQIKGTDPDKDLAVIAVQLKDITNDTMRQISISQLGDSNALIVGEPVIAIGNALGYGQSVTTGVVSALNRSIGSADRNNVNGNVNQPTFIQTDAAINPGNSGGALLNIRGQVIGINSNKIGGSVVEGIGYAIPISDAKPIIEDLMNKRTKLKVSESQRGVIGISGVNVEIQYAEIYGLPVGVYVSDVAPNKGAEKAGIVKGDIIVALNDKKIENMEDLVGELEYYAAGSTVTLTIMQSSPTGYQSKTVDVVLSKK